MSDTSPPDTPDNSPSETPTSQASAGIQQPPQSAYPPYPPYPTQFPPYSQYSGYPTPGYPPPGYPPYPQMGYPPPQLMYPQMYRPPKKDNSRTVYIIVAVVVVVLFLVCGGGVALVAAATNSLGNSLGVTLTPTTFCLDEETQDYPAAYQELSTNLQQQYSQDQFLQDGQQHDNSLGQISNCRQQGTATINGSTATITLQVTRMLTPTPDSSGNQPTAQTNINTGQVTLVKEGNQWKIDSIDSSLNLL